MKQDKRAWLDRHQAKERCLIRVVLLAKVRITGYTSTQEVFSTNVLVVHVQVSMQQWIAPLVVLNTKLSPKKTYILFILCANRRNCIVTWLKTVKLQKMQKL